MRVTTISEDESESENRSGIELEDKIECQGIITSVSFFEYASNCFLYYTIFDKVTLDVVRKSFSLPPSSIKKEVYMLFSSK